MVNVDELLQKMYPDYFNSFFPQPIPSLSLDDVIATPIHSTVAPRTANLTTNIGPITLNLPILSAAMSAVSGPSLGKVMSEVGGCSILYRTEEPEEQLEWIEEVTNHDWCLVKDPITLKPDQKIKHAKPILQDKKFSTIPVVDDEGKLVGILFTRGIAFDFHMEEDVSAWMKPFKQLKTAMRGTLFGSIKKRLITKLRQDSVLPVVDENQKLMGIYFMKDFLHANPSSFHKKPLIGMAIGVDEADLDRVREALKLKIGIIVIDSSHGACPPVIEQARRVKKIIGNSSALIAGNVADIGGYQDLALAGVDAVKAGIGSGAICTTSGVTGVGKGMFTLLRELRFMQKTMKSKGLTAPPIIADGGINNSGQMVKALMAGADLLMTGEWSVAASESISSIKHEAVEGDWVPYWGMASNRAIRSRTADRYGKQKTAAEGVEGLVKCKGHLKKWVGKETELIQAGFSHIGANNIQEAQKIGDKPTAFYVITAAGQTQNSARVKQE